jgi:phosphate starvation-inducible PhoH-like protein
MPTASAVVRIPANHLMGTLLGPADEYLEGRPRASSRRRAPHHRHGASADEAARRGAHLRGAAAARGGNGRPKTAGQKRYVDAIANNIITFGIGPAGTGKSWLAVAMAVQALQAKRSTASSSPARRSRRGSGWASCPAT